MHLLRHKLHEELPSVRPPEMNMLTRNVSSKIQFYLSKGLPQRYDKLYLLQEK